MLRANQFRFFSCDDDDNTAATQGSLQLEITDGPSDDTEIQGVFVTVADIQLNGESWSGFSGKTTFDLMALQNGNTRVLGMSDLEAQAYKSITLVLDYSTDAQDNQPGCYVLDADNQKEAIASSASEVTLNSDFEVVANEASAFVLDFDLRKALRYETDANAGDDSDEDDYELVTEAELQNALRLVKKSETGTITGTVQANDVNRVVAYAYVEGEFDRDGEFEGQGESEIQFAGAVTSAIVAENGDFQLSFLEPGDYELVLVAYQEEDNDPGDLEATGTLQTSLSGSLNLGRLTVEADSSLDLDISVRGILPF